MFDLINDDCVNILKQIPDKTFDLVLTDPPYELDNHGGGKTDLAQRKLVKDKHIDFISNGFDYDVVLAELIRICKIPNILLFCSNKQISKLMNYFEQLNYSTTLLVWKKTNPPPFCNGKHVSETEFIIYVRGKNAPFNNGLPTTMKKKIKEYPSPPSKSRTHPTEKPIKLLEEYINLHSLENDLILDCFMGTGSTGVACMNLNRKFFGIEINKEYFDIAESRINEAMKQNEIDNVFKKVE